LNLDGDDATGFIFRQNIDKGNLFAVVVWCEFAGLELQLVDQRKADGLEMGMATARCALGPQFPGKPENCPSVRSSPLRRVLSLVSTAQWYLEVPERGRARFACGLGEKTCGFCRKGRLPLTPASSNRQYTNGAMRGVFASRKLRA